MPPLFPLTLSLYAVSCTLSCVPFIGWAQAAPAERMPPLQKAARWTLVLAFLSQALDIAWLCIHGHHPAFDAHEAVFFASWLITGVYLLLQMRYAVAVLAALVIPVVMVLQVLARLSPDAPHASSAAAGGVTLLASAHVLCATLGSAIFAVAAGASVLYLLTEQRLKLRRPKPGAGRSGRGNPLRHLTPPLNVVDLGEPGQEGPRPGLMARIMQVLAPRRGLSLESLDTLNRHCITLGFPVFTAALITGTVWIGHLSALGPGGQHLSAIYLRPQYVFAVLTWLVYGVLLLGRVTAGVRGRRAALATLAGFLTTLMVLLLYLFRGGGLGGGNS